MQGYERAPGKGGTGGVRLVGTARKIVYKLAEDLAAGKGGDGRGKGSKICMRGERGQLNIQRVKLPRAEEGQERGYALSPICVDGEDLQRRERL